MSDLICRKTMMRCQTPSMCSPFGGCQAGVLVQTDVRYAADAQDEPAGEDVRGRIVAAYGKGRWLREYDALVAERDQLRAEVEAGEQWRTLALQFDHHRMMALSHLKAVVSNPNASNIQACQAFLEAGPVRGHVVEQLMAADAIESIVHYVVSKSDQDVLRRIVLEKRREAGLEAAMAAKEGV